MFALATLHIGLFVTLNSVLVLRFLIYMEPPIIHHLDIYLNTLTTLRLVK